MVYLLAFEWTWLKSALSCYLQIVRECKEYLSNRSQIAQAGGNGLLIEYEDMFPYWGPVANASALNAFTTDEINQVFIQ